jgi:hypothetical protein
LDGTANKSTGSNDVKVGILNTETNDTFDTVDEKVAETEFFLGKMAEVKLNFFEFKCYMSAYLSAARTTTLALQHFKHIPGFLQWYEPHRRNLQTNSLAKFFHKIRNDHAHGGPYPISGGSFHQGEAHYYFSQSDEANQIQQEDIVSACRDFFIVLLEVIYDCYVKLGVYIDPQQHYTKEHFATQGRNIDDAELEVFGWICTSLIEDGFDEDNRWHELRGHVDECKINHLFYSYLGKPTPQPPEPDYYDDFSYSPEEKGWVHIPAGFVSIEDYLEYIHKSRNENKQFDKT